MGGGGNVHVYFFLHTINTNTVLVFYIDRSHANILASDENLLLSIGFPTSGQSRPNLGQMACAFWHMTHHVVYST